MNTGLVYVFTGEGKGKTSAALGVATRSLLLEKKVAWIALYKQASWGLSEAKLSDKFDNLDMVFAGRGFRIVNPEQTKGKVKLATVGRSAKVIDTASEDEHMAAAQASLELARKKIQSSHYFLVVLDEVLNAISEGLVREEELIEILGLRGETHVILTGRGATKKIIDIADLVTECRKIKHPYDSGKLAVQGLDF